MILSGFLIVALFFFGLFFGLFFVMILSSFLIVALFFFGLFFVSSKQTEKIGLIFLGIGIILFIIWNIYWFSVFW